jgi:hypothetical protein
MKSASVTNRTDDKKASPEKKSEALTNRKAETACEKTKSTALTNREEPRKTDSLVNSVIQAVTVRDKASPEAKHITGTNSLPGTETFSGVNTGIPRTVKVSPEGKLPAAQGTKPMSAIGTNREDSKAKPVFNQP